MDHEKLANLFIWSVAISGIEKVNSKNTRVNVEKMYPDKRVFLCA